MLVLTRRVGERVLIGSDIVLTIVDLRSSRVRIGIEAPPDVPIRREELPVQHAVPSFEPPTAGPTAACG